MGDVNQKNKNLYEALNLFILKVREFISSEFENKYGASWVDKEYHNCLTDFQKEIWNKEKEANNTENINIIDFGNLRKFALNHRSFLREHISNRSINDLPTIFNQIKDARDRVMHFIPFDTTTEDLAYAQMENICRVFNWVDLRQEIISVKNKLKHTKPNISPAQVKQSTISNSKFKNLKNFTLNRKWINDGLLITVTNTNGDKYKYYHDDVCEQVKGLLNNMSCWEKDKKYSKTKGIPGWAKDFVENLNSND